MLCRNHHIVIVLTATNAQLAMPYEL